MDHHLSYFVPTIYQRKGTELFGKFYIGLLKFVATLNGINGIAKSKINLRSCDSLLRGLVSQVDGCSSSSGSHLVGFYLSQFEIY